MCLLFIRFLHFKYLPFCFVEPNISVRKIHLIQNKNMAILFEIIKVFFFVLSVLMALFFMRGYYFLPDSSFTSWSNILMPLYLLVSWLIIWYVALLFHKTKINAPLTQHHRTRWFIGWLLVWVIFAVFYILAH